MKHPHFKTLHPLLCLVTNVPLLVVVVGKMGVGVGAVVTIVAVPGGDDAANGKATAGMGVRAQLAGVSMGVAVGAVWSGVVREGGVPKGVVIPGLGSLIHTCCHICYDGFLEGHGGVRCSFSPGGYLAGGLGNGE